MVQPRTSEDWTPEIVGRFWAWRSSKPDQLKHYFSRHLGRALRNCLRACGILRGRVLDYGCGPGFLLRLLGREKGVECEGVDFSPTNAEQTAEKMTGMSSFKGVSVVKGLPTQLADGRFDLITCIEVVEHLNSSQLAETLAELNRLLAPTGILFLTTPNDEDLDRNQHYCPFCDSEFHRVQHQRAFTSASLRDALESAGLEVLFCEGIDMHRFQAPRRPRLVDWSPRFIYERYVRKLVYAGAFVADAVVRGKLTRRFRFRTRRTQGEHLVALARRKQS